MNTYRLRFESDEPESENPTLEQGQALDSRVGKVETNPTLEAPASLLYLKKQKDKTNSLPSLGSSNQNQLHNQPPDIPPAPIAPTLDGDQVIPGGAIDFRTGEPIPQPAKRKTKFRTGKPKPERPYSLSERMRADRESHHNGALDSLGSIATPRQVPQTIPDPQGVTEVKPEPFPDRWNRMVTAAPADASLLAANPPSYREPVFVERFDEICRKSAALIAAGADLKFGFLLMRNDKAAGRYRWQELLADELEWMKPRSNSKSKLPDASTWAANMRRKAEEGKLNETRT